MERKTQMSMEAAAGRHEGPASSQHTKDSSHKGLGDALKSSSHELLTPPYSRAEIYKTLLLRQLLQEKEQKKSTLKNIPGIQIQREETQMGTLRCPDGVHRGRLSPLKSQSTKQLFLPLLSL